MAATLTTRITLEEFSRLPDDGNKHELNEGELVVMPPPKSLHSLVAARVFEVLLSVVKQLAIGRLLMEAGYVLSRDPLTVRQPDVSIVGTERFLATAEDQYFEGAPELAVEVVFLSDSAQDLVTKVRQYLRFGAKQVWVLYPKSKSVHIFRPNTTMVLEENETLDGGDLLSGFSVKVADLFV
jgi:Uma2 family endonuclease